MKIDLDESVAKLIQVLDENEELDRDGALKVGKIKPSPTIRRNLKRFSQFDVQINRRTCKKGKNYEKPWLLQKKMVKKSPEKTVDEFGLPKDAVTLHGVNFRAKNISTIRNSAPPQIKPRFVDRRFGDTQNVLPRYENREERARPDEGSSLGWKKKEETSNKLVPNGEENSTSLCRYVKNEEREQLLHNMKLRWEEMMREFRTLPFVLDTVPLIRKKRNLEKDLSQLEKDIDAIERHPRIVVYDDSKGFLPREKFIQQCLKRGVFA